MFIKFCDIDLFWGHQGGGASWKIPHNELSGRGWKFGQLLFGKQPHSHLIYYLGSLVVEVLR